MDTNEIKIRPATEADAAEILNIYAPYIRTQQLHLNMMFRHWKSLPDGFVTHWRNIRIWWQ